MRPDALRALVFYRGGAFVEEISSRKNAMVRAAAALHEPAARRAQGAFLCEGARLCADAADSGLQLRQLFCTQAALRKYAVYLQRLLPRAQAAYLVSEPVAALLSDTRSSQGVFCVCGAPARAHVGLGDFASREPCGTCLALERVQDPANLGTILRTAEALGVGTVLLCGEGCDPFSPKALRGGMGAAFRLELVRAADFAPAAARLRAAGWRCYAAVPDAAAVPVTAVDFSAPSLLAVGNEGAGLLPASIAACDGSVTIPMRGRAESLNASASAAILLWEMVREGGAGHG